MITGRLGTTPTTKLHFVFDAWNRMVTVKADSSGSPGSTIASYTYDGRNRRITKTIGGSTYHGYYNNRSQYLETRIGSSTSSSGQIVWDLRYIDSPLALLGGTNPLYYTNDANFNVTSLINGSTGAVSERSQYDPYGYVQFYTAAWATTSSSAANNPILYAGYTFDSESGLYLARNRYLNVATGTWEKRDQMQYINGANQYAYASGNPQSATDPSGNVLVFGEPKLAQFALNALNTYCPCLSKWLNLVKYQVGNEIGYAIINLMPLGGQWEQQYCNCIKCTLTAKEVADLREANLNQAKLIAPKSRGHENACRLVWWITRTSEKILVINKPIGAIGGTTDWNGNQPEVILAPGVSDDVLMHELTHIYKGEIHVIKLAGELETTAMTNTYLFEINRMNSVRLKYGVQNVNPIFQPLPKTSTLLNLPKGQIPGC